MREGLRVLSGRVDGRGFALLSTVYCSPALRGFAALGEQFCQRNGLYKKCRFRDARPDPVFRYFSKSSAFEA